MNEKKLLAYLQAHPEFLLNHAAELGVQPAQGRVQSFVQAQWLAQQEKAAKMAGQLAQIMQDADSNHQTLGRLLGFVRRLLAANTLLQVLRAAEAGLREDFGLASGCVWLLAEPPKKGAPAGAYRLPENHAAHAALRALKAPLCDNHISPALIKALPQQGKGLESFLLLPVRVNGQTVAVLAAGDADETRFTPDLPLDWVRELAACTAAALARAGGWQ
ncbi:DUF484 family protein [Eikenella sp. Marseille-P7795]|uniref:DUF484 family protein n=1 Tax=Eikenella sp. Marseille-P7795 TaxID=2866577 RepID=UPI001CE46C64|nr:DUF484 family protein [Eikenella sp. Marseille-P7795]